MKYLLFVLSFGLGFNTLLAQVKTYAYGKVILPSTDSTTPFIKNINYQLDSFYNKRVAKGFSGQVLVGYKGVVIYERYFGFANKATNELINAATPSQLASTSKPITAIAVAILKERGLLNFDDSVQTYIPNFPYKDITLRHLLTHRSGLPEYFGLAMGAKNYTTDTLMSNDSLVQLLITKHPKAVRQPNTKFKYCNTNYALLSYIVSVVSQQPFAQFVQTNIFNALGMANSYIFNHTNNHAINYCKSYKNNWLPINDMRLDGVTGDKSCYSTVQDLYKLDQALYTNRLLSQNTINEMYQPYSNETNNNQNYGLGWRMFNYPEQKVIFHNGYWHGNNNCFYRFVTDNFTVIILGNKFNKYNYAHPKIIYNLITNSTLAINDDEVE
jgi:CubicO group peptidase (beta-lactamase class C family)